MSVDLDSKSLLLYFSLGLNLAFVLGLIFFLWPARYFWSRSRPARGHFFREEVGVDRPRWRKIKPRLEKFRQQKADLDRRMRELRGKLLEAVAADTPAATGKVKRFQQQLLELERQKQKLLFDHFQVLKGVLTPEQTRNFFRQLKRRHHGPHRGHRRNMGNMHRSRRPRRR